MNPKFTIIICFSASLFVSSSLHVIAEENEQGAITAVEELHAILLDTMKNANELGYQGRYNLLEPVIKSNFDTPVIAKVILGRYWKELDDQQQSKFIELFNQLSISTYASRFDDYSNEEFKTLGVEKLKKGRLLVRTELIRPGDSSVRFDYLIHSKEDRWYIISVIADGINDLALKRAEYGNVIKKKGFDSLIIEIENKIIQSQNS
jgi:phospholipid transport system substrate-binding protein